MAGSAIIVPTSLTVGGWSGSPGTDSSSWAVSRSSAAGAHSIHAPARSAAASADQPRWNTVTSGSGTGSKTRRVTIPRWPPPAPRSAQNRSS